MNISVVKNAKRNMLFGTINKTVAMICPFVERTVIQVILGAQYLGLSSLFTSILSVLSLTELGFNLAVVYHMYKPVADGDVSKVNALLNYYKKAYRIIGIFIIALGLAVVPFLDRFISGGYPAEVDIRALYVIYVCNAAVSYFLFAYMTSIVVVNQRDDIQSSVNSVIRVVLTATQAVILFVSKSYFLFVIMMPIFTVINNLLVAWRIRHYFPQYKPEGDISEQDKNSIKRLVAGTFIQRACAVTRNSLDSICISAFLGLTLTAIYSNYYLILNGISVFIGVISTAFLGGVGNHVATKPKKDNFDELLKLNFAYLWIGGWASICLFCLFQPFMQLWMGDEMMLDLTAVGLLVVYFYMLKLGDMITMYSAANGLWWKHRYRATSETIINLILNIALGKAFGIYGIIVATMISLFFCNYIWATRIIFKSYFGLHYQKQYYLSQGRQTAVTLVACLVTYCVCLALPRCSVILMLAARMLICIIVPNVVYYLVFRNSDLFDYVKKKMLRI